MLYRVVLANGAGELLTRRVACCLGPQFNTGQAFWESDLREALGSQRRSSKSSGSSGSSGSSNKASSSPNLPAEEAASAPNPVPALPGAAQQEAQPCARREAEQGVPPVGVEGEEQHQHPCLTKRLLRADEVAQWLLDARSPDADSGWSGVRRVLVVGGGITSSHLVSAALCGTEGSGGQGSVPANVHVTLCKRSGSLLQRQFDIDASWMGPHR
jgi:hypothetical protein